MKKTLISIVVLSMAIISLAFTACSGKKDSVSGSGTAKESVKKNEKSNGKANPESDFRVEVTDNGEGIRILEYIGQNTNIIIPETIQGMSVLEINPDFVKKDYKWIDDKGKQHEGNNTIKKIVFPDTVTEFTGNIPKIGDLIALEYVKLPKHLKNKAVYYEYIDEWVIAPPISFGGCKKLKEVVIPDEVEFEEMVYFALCESLKSIKIPASVKYFENPTFYGCSNLEEIIIPETALKYEFGDSKYGAFEGTKLPIKTQAKLKQLGYTGSF